MASVDSTMPREGMEEEACEVSAVFSCEEAMEEEASIEMNRDSAKGMVIA